jgi:hypothetical protein
MRAATVGLLVVGLSALATLGGCRVGDGVEVVPIRGDVPETVAIWPLVAGGEPPDDELWFTGLAYQLGRRGYRVIAPGVALEMLAESDLAVSLDDEASIGRALQADAVLHLDVRAFDAEGDRTLQQASWDVVWQLLSTRGQGRQWTFVAHGRWRQADRDPLDSSRSFDEQVDPPPIVPIGGHTVPGFRDVRDLMAHLNRNAMSHLPERHP